MRRVGEETRGMGRCREAGGHGRRDRQRGEADRRTSAGRGVPGGVEGAARERPARALRCEPRISEGAGSERKLEIATDPACTLTRPQAKTAEAGSNNAAGASVPNAFPQPPSMREAQNASTI